MIPPETARVGLESKKTDEYTQEPKKKPCRAFLRPEEATRKKTTENTMDPRQRTPQRTVKGAAQAAVQAAEKAARINAVFLKRKAASGGGRKQRWT